MSENNFAIGTTNFNASKFGNRKWHKMEPGDNYFRILPPMFSLAAEGRYSAYWAFHGGFKNTQGTVQMFKCIQTKDKNKLIKQHCPVCDLVVNLTAHYDRLKDAQKAGQISQDEVRKFWDTQIFPIRAQKGFFVNAMNRAGEVGQLLLPYKCNQAVDQALKSCAERNGVDPTGVNGAWINIKKVQPFKGSPDVSYGAEIAMERTSDGNFRLAAHVLTAELIQNVVQASARDLNSMFREISPQDVAQLAGVQPEQRAALVDRIFGKPEVNVAASPLTVQAPGTQATLVGRVEPTPNGGYQVAMPSVPPTQTPGAPFMAPVQHAAPPAAPVSTLATPPAAPPAGFQPPPAAPTVVPQTTGFVATAPGVPPTAPPTAAPAAPTTMGGVPVGQSNLGGQAPTAISDADFRNIFGQ